MPQLLLIFLFAAAVRALTEQTRRDLAKWRGRPARPARPGRLANWWRRHVTAGNAGYWGHQAAHGFPTARHGLHDGWTRGREAHHRAQRGIARNRAERAEGQAEHEPEMAGYRRRRAGALAELERQRQQEEIDRAHAEAELEGQQREQHPEWFGGAEPVLCGHQGMPCRWPEHCSCQCEQCLAARAAAPSGETGPPPEDEQQEADEDRQPEDEQQEPEQEEHDWPDPEQAPASQGNQGDEMTEATYQGVKARMDKAAAEAEQMQADAEQSQAYTEEHMEAARQAKDWASATADEMQALEVDAGSLGAMADHLAALDEAEKAAAELNEQMGQVKNAWAKVQESAQAVTAALEAGGHRQLDEAHANAAGGGAKKEFYEEG